jgi:peptidoglycan/LPS O-acetylase OafA/YrhL
MTTEHSSRRFGMDVLRAAAIGLVVVSHYWTAQVFLGSIGVDLFFALSGFLIGGILLKMVERRGAFPAGDLYEFLRRRWYRTLPNYYLYLLLFLLFYHLHGPRPPGAVVPPAFGLYFVFLQNFAWPKPSPFFGVSWSLCVEEWFYLLTAGTLFLLSRAAGQRPQGVRAAFGVTAAVFIALPIALRFFPNLRASDDWKNLVVLRIDAIMYGVLMAAARIYWPTLWRGPVAGALLVAGAGVVVATALLGASLPEVVAPSLTPLGFACTLAFFDRLGRPAGLAAAAVEWLSLRSYSMYLCHGPIYLLFWGAVDYDHAAAPLRLAVKAGALLTTALVSEATYRFYEKPLMDLRDRPRPRPGTGGGGK